MYFHPIFLLAGVFLQMLSSAALPETQANEMRERDILGLTTLAIISPNFAWLILRNSVFDRWQAKSARTPASSRR